MASRERIAPRPNRQELYANRAGGFDGNSLRLARYRIPLELNATPNLNEYIRIFFHRTSLTSRVMPFYNPSPSPKQLLRCAPAVWVDLVIVLLLVATKLFLAAPALGPASLYRDDAWQSLAVRVTALGHVVKPA